MDVYGCFHLCQKTSANRSRLPRAARSQQTVINPSGNLHLERVGSPHGDLAEDVVNPWSGKSAMDSYNGMFSITLVATRGAVGTAKSPTIGERENDPGGQD